MTHKALPDWRWQQTETGRFTAEGVEAWKQRCRKFFSKRKADKSDESKKDKPMQAKRMANFDSLAGLDQSLRSTYGFGIAGFVPSRPLRPLDDKHTRNYAPIESLPAALQAIAAGRTRRAVLVDDESGAAVLETAWDEDRRVLHCMLDCGSVGWPGKNWMFYSAECRGERWIDPPHRRSDNITDALQDSQLSSFRAEALLLVNCAAGPWWGAANHQAWREAGLEWIDSVGPSDELFQAVYAWVVHDWTKGRLPNDMFAKGHIELTFNMLRDHLNSRGKGDIVRLSRWFQVWTKTRAFLPDWSANFVVNLSWRCLSHPARSATTWERPPQWNLRRHRDGRRHDR